MKLTLASLLGLGLLIGCSNAPDVASVETTQRQLPAIDFSGMSENVRATVEASLAVVRSEPGEPKNWYALGQCLMAHEVTKEAEDVLEIALELDPSFSEARYLAAIIDLEGGRFDESNAGLKLVDEEFKARNSRGYAPARMRLARNLNNQGEFERARSVLDALTAEFPSFDEGRLELATFLTNSGEGASALPILRKLEERFPSDRNIVSLMARALALTGEEELSMTYLERSRRLKKSIPNDDPILFEVYQMGSGISRRITRVLAQLSAGNGSQALAEAEGLVKAAPDSANHWVLLGRAANLAKREAQALEAFEKALELSPTNTSVRLSAARVALKTDALPRAIEHARQLLSTEHAAKAHALMGQAHVFQAEYVEANQHYEALAATSDALAITDRMMWSTAQLQLGLPDAAEANLREAVQMDPKFAPAQFNHAQALELLSRPAEAIEAYQRALKLNPQLPAADRIRRLQGQAR